MAGEAQMFTSRMVIIVALTLVFTLSPQPSKAVVSPGERCEGLAIVWPPGKDPGSIYVGSRLIATSERYGGEVRIVESYQRMGYLPSGTVINLEEPPEDTRQGPRLHKTHCGFRFRSAIVGHIDRGHIEKLDNVIRLSKMNRDDIGFISPADYEKVLELYKTADFSSSPIDSFSRTNRVIIIVSRRELNSDSDAVQVQYTTDPKNPVFAKAYVKVSEDRAHNMDGTFRSFRPYSLSSTRNASGNISAVALDIPKYLEGLGVPANKVTEFVAKMAQYPNIGGCAITHPLCGVVTRI
jgi:hypothetical protein